MKDRSAHSSTLNLLQINLLPGNYYPIAHNCKMVAFLNLHYIPPGSCPPVSLVKLFGCSAAAQVKTSREAKGQYLSVNMAFSVGVMSAMYLSKGISGTNSKNPQSLFVINICFFLICVPLSRRSSEPSSDSELLCTGPGVLGQTGALLPLPVAGGLYGIRARLPGLLR